MRSLRLFCLLLIGLVVSPLRAEETLRFIYPPPENAQDQRHTYYWELLKAALETNKGSFGPYLVTPFDKPMNYARAMIEIESGNGLVNITTRATNLELETRLRPIPIPLDKALLGYRLFLINKNLQPRLHQVQSLEQLKQFSIGQSSFWTDFKILDANGFKLKIENNYEGLFHMLAAGRFDLLARGLTEIRAELKSHRTTMPNLAIEEGLLLHYPMPRYFFVPRTAEGERMAARIEDGLQRLRRSGEFERRYQAYKKLVLTDIKLSGRKVFRIDNPQLSALAPTTDKYWWDDLATELDSRPDTKTIPQKPRPKAAE